MKFNLILYGVLAVVVPMTVFTHLPQDEKSSGLKNVVILVIRHAEKPAEGYGLSAAGESRAQTYVSYFKNFTVSGQPLKLDYLFAAADSKKSYRPRLTIEPTSKSLGLAIDSRFKNKQFQKLADEIKSKAHGKAILIAWHHGKLPQLIRALGADPGQLLPDANWPGLVFNWVIELRYDSDGRLVEAKRINEAF